MGCEGWPCLFPPRAALQTHLAPRVRNLKHLIERHSLVSSVPTCGLRPVGWLLEVKAKLKMALVIRVMLRLACT